MNSGTMIENFTVNDLVFFSNNNFSGKGVGINGASVANQKRNLNMVVASVQVPANYVLFIQGSHPTEHLALTKSINKLVGMTKISSFVLKPVRNLTASDNAEIQRSQQLIQKLSAPVMVITPPPKPVATVVAVKPATTVAVSTGASSTTPTTLTSSSSSSPSVPLPANTAASPLPAASTIVPANATTHSLTPVPEAAPAPASGPSISSLTPVTTPSSQVVVNVQPQLPPPPPPLQGSPMPVFGAPDEPQCSGIWGPTNMPDRTAKWLVPAIDWWTFTDPNPYYVGKQFAVSNAMKVTLVGIVDDCCKVFLNGDLVGSFCGDWGGTPPTLPLNLTAGMNTLIFAIENSGGGPTGVIACIKDSAGNTMFKTDETWTRVDPHSLTGGIITFSPYVDSDYPVNADPLVQAQFCAAKGNVYTAGMNDSFPGCGQGWCCVPSNPDWRKSSYTGYVASDYPTFSGTVDQAKFCASKGNVFTGGKNDQFPGCGAAWCCT
jgi:hypothetical protein